MPLALVALLMSCAEPYVYPSNGKQVLPQLTDTHAVMDDGYRLPLTRWTSVGNTRAIVLAVHGLNEYSFVFDSLGQYLSSHGITLIAYDQRGFGNSAGQGLWHGSERLGRDLVAVTELVREQHNDIPLYLLGESMGGAVVLSSLASTHLDVDGSILLAPAVWTRDSMPFYQRFGLWLAAHTMPSRKLTGEGLDLMPSDNIDMLRTLSRDELVIKATRVDVLYGISNLMDNAMIASSEVSGNILLLYGQHDDIIPAPPVCELYDMLSASKAIRLSAASYPDGYHMLARDLQAERVHADIAAWMTGPGPDIPSSNSMHSFCVAQAGSDE